jgi:tetratricopeptide (TPR) repeat protein
MRAALAVKTGGLKEAKTMALRALAALHDRPVDAIAARHLLAETARASGRFDEAHAELHAALTIARELDLAPLHADLLFTRARVRHAQGRIAEAIADLTAALEQVERVRGSLHAERFRAAFLGDRSNLHQWLVSLLLDLNDDRAAIDHAFQVAEQAKSRMLLEQMQQAVASGPVEEPGESDSGARPILNEIDRVRSELNALYSRMGEDAERPSVGSHRWHRAIRDREHALDEFEGRLRTTQDLGAFYAPAASAAEIRSRIDDDAAIVEFFAGRDELITFVLRRDAMRACRTPLKGGTLAERIRSLRFQMNRALRVGALEGARADRLINDAQRELLALYELTIGPIREHLQGVGRLTIVPQGPLHLLPFQALWDGRRHLVGEFEIHQVPSANLLGHLRSQAAAPFGSAGAAVIGVADEIAPEIEDEARLVAQTLGCDPQQVLIGPAATANRVRELVSRAQTEAGSGGGIVHFACHGRFAAETPMASGLKLADRWLTVRDIYALRLSAGLVTLSGCETGMNAVQAGDELMGLLRAFLAAGSSSLLVSLWRVDDQTTREFMALFYGLLSTAHSPRRTTAAVVRSAQIELMAKHPHPAFWAPFILVGRE